jgi:hypothetical protein
MKARWRTVLARAFLLVSALISLIFICEMAFGFLDFYRDTHTKGELSPELIAELKAHGIPADGNTRMMDFAGGTVVHVTPTSMIVFIPIILIFIAYVIDHSSIRTRGGLASMALATLTFLVEVALLTLTLYWPA